MRRALDLFSGSGSVTKALEDCGFDVVSVDVSNAYSTPTHHCCVWEYDEHRYEPDHFDLVWASPPCETFSTARRLCVPRHMTEEERIDDQICIGLPLVARAIAIMQHHPDALHVLENPHSGDLKNYVTGNDFPWCSVVDYCRYGDNSSGLLFPRKRTALWSNRDMCSAGFEPLLCHGGLCGTVSRGRHLATVCRNRSSALGMAGAYGGTSRRVDKYRVPAKLVHQIAECA